ncbi:hypothetical protein C4577_04350 [Candidatus Parcubacteria bacterium]|nr:MAG: hypothetical protein C4577_04350 [Candidatus Parcubacteria bacterium]
MKITVCGSIKSADKIVEVHNKLKEMGHRPIVHELMFRIAKGEVDKYILEGRELDKAKRKYNLIKWWYQAIIESDAVVICNFDKKGIKNYIGGNTLMEIGFAYVNDKKIYLMNPVPEDVPYIDEIKAMVDNVLDGDLSKIR